MPSASRRPLARYPSVMEGVVYTSTSEPEKRWSMRSFSPVACLTVDLGASSGVVISASHNPPEYNGIKVFGSAGHKLSDELEDEIEHLVRTEAETEGPRGSVTELGEATERYVKHLVEASEATLD